jgi:hypothetical protein
VSQNYQLDGMSIFQWRARAQEIAEYFAEFADHKDRCVAARTGHWHRPPEVEDSRVVCEDAPCTCALLMVLSSIMPTMTWVVRCPNKPALLPVRQVWCQFDLETDCIQASLRLKLPSTYCQKPHRVPANL